MKPDGSAPQLTPSSNLQSGGSLLVDNVLLVTSTPTSTNVAGPTSNVCTGVSADNYNGPIPTSPVDLRASCFTTGYQGVAGQILGANPDTGIAPGTKWEDVPPNWTCPDCGARKEDYELVEF